VTAPVDNSRPSHYIQYDQPMFSSPTITTFNPSNTNANWRVVTGADAATDITVSVDPSAAKSRTGVEIRAGIDVPTKTDDICIHYVSDTGS